MANVCRILEIKGQPVGKRILFRINKIRILEIVEQLRKSKIAKKIVIFAKRLILTKFRKYLWSFEFLQAILKLASTIDGIKRIYPRVFFAGFMNF